MIDYRFDIINFLAEKYYNNDCSYLEIGVENPDNCFNRINATRKTSVDPTKIRQNTNIDYLMTSDKFFERVENGSTVFDADFKWDIIFIDGLHLADQAYRDIINAAKHCAGFILLHDCAPPNFWNAHTDYDYFLNYGGDWNGSTWKAFYKYRTETDRKTYTVDTDWGIGVIDVRTKDTPIKFENTWYEYGKFKSNMINDLGLISKDQFISMHENT